MGVGFDAIIDTALRMSKAPLLADRLSQLPPPFYSMSAAWTFTHPLW